MNEEETVIKNVDAALNQLTDHEAHVRDHIMHEYFAPLKIKHWEGLEVEKYQQNMSLE
jgi:hypothetical protein